MWWVSLGRGNHRAMTRKMKSGASGMMSDHSSSKPLLMMVHHSKKFTRSGRFILHSFY